ncbi:MAG TPA: hypothetical protein VJS92_07880 [Candidatus Polarisedimenticolaceae bacterium]|nr:hypothetical protein [Candidatus Polarisedimenticolaceae bacterium]
MAGKLTATLFAPTAAVLLAASAFAQQGQQPQMTPEQKAEMEAYMKAGTPGAPHQALGATAGTYDTKIRAAGTTRTGRRWRTRAPRRARCRWTGACWSRSSTAR